MSRIYTVVYNGTYTAAGTDTDLFLLLPASNKPIKLRGFTIGQSSEFGDAQEEDVRVTVRRFSATVTNGSGGTTPTPNPMDSADAAAGFTAHTNDTTVATTNGTGVILEELAWNERNTPYEHWYPDTNYCPKAKNGEALIVRAETTVADDVTICITAWVEEE